MMTLLAFCRGGNPTGVMMSTRRRPSGDLELGPCRVGELSVDQELRRDPPRGSFLDHPVIECLIGELRPSGDHAATVPPPAETHHFRPWTDRRREG
jgi:hypothetical protein